MPTRRVTTKTLRTIRATTKRNPLPAPRAGAVNASGIDLPPKTLTKVRRAVAQIERGEARTFNSADDAVDWLFRKRR